MLPSSIASRATRTRDQTLNRTENSAVASSVLTYMLYKLGDKPEQRSTLADELTKNKATFKSFSGPPQTTLSENNSIMSSLFKAAEKNTKARHDVRMADEAKPS
ncbi:hypothetical protein L204_102078 [Cryptococcus depauperatus]|nr:hypothetical protein L204_04562 [Cryptococcus depauperatus CBS 7855]